MATPDKSKKENPFPKKGVDTSPEGMQDHPLTAEKWAEEHGIDKNTPIVTLFTPQQKKELLRMMKHHEFNDRESAVLKAMMSTGDEGEAFNFEELGVFIGASSPRTKGEPTSKVAAYKELNRILEVLAKRAHFQGKTFNLELFKKFKHDRNELIKKNKKLAAERKKKEREMARRRAEAQKEFWKELTELNKLQRSKGLEPSRYDKIMKAWTTGHKSLDSLKVNPNDR